MILSQIILNPMSRRARGDVSNPYDMHRTLSRAFEKNGEVEKFLFRIESDFARGSKSLVALAQSGAEPDFSKISDEFSNYFVDAASKKIPDEKLARSFRTGASFFFRLVANPTKKQGNRRLGIYDEKKQLDWLERKAELGGFKVLSATVADFSVGNKTMMQNIAKSGKEISKNIIFNICARYDGILQIVDPDLFLKSYLKGVGPAKSFGCGLLTVKKIE